MKNNFKITLLLFAMVFSILFTGCQEEDVDLNPSNQSQEINKVSAANLMMLLKDDDIKNSILEYTSIKKSNDGLSLDYFEKLDFKDFDNYTLFVNDYTAETPYYKSMVITIDDNTGAENAMFVQYTPTDDGFDGSQPFNIHKFNGKMEIFDLQMNHLGSGLLHGGALVAVLDSMDCTTEITISIVPCSHDGGHVPGQSCTQDFVNDSYFLVSVRYDCDYSYVFAGGGTTTGGSNGGGGAGSGPTSSEVFYGKLSQAQQEFLDANQKIKGNVEAFLGKFSYANQTAFDYAKMMIDKMMATGLVFDIYRSLRSPAHIDVTSVQGNTPEEVKFRKVYDKLTDIPKFKELFVNLFGPTNSINAVFKIDNIASDGNTQAKLSSKGARVNEITLNRDLLLSSSDIRIARIIIHECIHAYLIEKLRDPSIGMSIEDINNMDFTETVNELYNGLMGNPAQHDFFVDHMVPVISEILSQGKQVLLTQEQIATVDNPQSNLYFIYLPTNTIPATNSGIQTPWIWTDFFKYFSLEGLHNASSFNTVYPTDSAEYYLFNRYLVVATVAFQP